MHTKIIRIESLDLPREDWKDYLDEEDETLLANTDYFGDMYDEEERRQVITSNWLKELLDGIATIDTDAETLTFLDKETIQKTLRDYYLSMAKKIMEEAENNCLSGYSFREAGRCFRDFSTLFYTCYGQTSLDFVEDALYLILYRNR